MLIGDYIHYNYDNFEQYGISFNTPAQVNASQVFKTQKKLLKKLYPKKRNKEQIQQLEDTLNLFFAKEGTTVKNKDWTERELEILQEAVINIFQNTINLQSRGVKDINYKDLNVFMKETLSTIINMVKTGSLSTPEGNLSYEEVKKARKKLGVKEVEEGKDAFKDYTKWEAIQQRLKVIEQVRNAVAANIKQGATEQEFIKKVEELNKAYKELENKKENGKFDLKTDKHQSFIELLNETSTYLKNYTSSHMLGVVGEEIPKITFAVANYMIANGVNDLTKDIEDIVSDITGGVKYSRQKVARSAKQIDKRRFIGGNNKEYLEKTYNNAKLKLVYTEDKIDANFALNENDFIPASIKNYDITNTNFSALKGTDILSFIQDYPVFANHYLNVTADHNDKHPSSSLLDQAHETLKQTIALHALAGGTWSKKRGQDFSREKMAEVFVVNYHGNNKGKYKIYFINDLLNKIEKNLELLNIQVDGVSDLMNPEWKNDYVEGPKNFKTGYKRIASMLADINSRSFSVQVNKEIFDKKEKI